MKSRKRSLQFLIVVLAVLFVLTLSFGVTGAYYGGTVKSKSELLYENGVVFDFLNVNASKSMIDSKLQISGKLQYRLTTNQSESLKNLSNVESQENVTYYIANPTISVKYYSKNFYARAKIEYTFYDRNGDEATATELGAESEASLISQLLASNVSFGNLWKKKVVDDGYYYYCASGAANCTSSTIEKIVPNAKNVAEKTVELFNNLTLQTNTWESLNGGPYGLTKFEISLKLDVIEENGKSEWFT